MEVYREFSRKTATETYATAELLPNALLLRKDIRLQSKEMGNSWQKFMRNIKLCTKSERTLNLKSCKNNHNDSTHKRNQVLSSNWSNAAAAAGCVQ